jgi:uncharacterized membrane protein YeaQ/YmgE (transglycosylase-associated protein family)
MSSIGGAVDGIISDQSKYYKDAFRPRHLIPSIVGLVVVLCGFLALYLSQPPANPTPEESDDAKPGMIAGGVMVGLGFLTMIVVGIVLAVRNPRAFAQQQVVRAIF